jgi:hypothetical protein
VQRPVERWAEHGLHPPFLAWCIKTKETTKAGGWFNVLDTIDKNLLLMPLHNFSEL